MAHFQHFFFFFHTAAEMIFLKHDFVLSFLFFGNSFLKIVNTDCETLHCLTPAYLSSLNNDMVSIALYNTAPQGFQSF